MASSEVGSLSTLRAIRADAGRGNGAHEHGTRYGVMTPGAVRRVAVGLFVKFRVIKSTQPQERHRIMTRRAGKTRAGTPSHCHRIVPQAASARVSAGC